VKRRLLGRRRERPGDLQPALGSEYEPQLARRPQPIGPVGPERRAGTVLADRAQLVALKEALLTARLLNYPTFRHSRANTPLHLDARLQGPASKRTSGRRRGSILGKRKKFTSARKPSNSGMFCAGPAIS
jgi:hypothetical protein